MAAALVGLVASGCAGHGGHGGSLADSIPDAPVAGTEHRGMAVGESEAAFVEPFENEIEPYQPRFGRDRPVVAVVGAADGVELTDFVVPHGILVASGVADVVALSTESGPIAMFPALTFQPDATTAEFDREYPEGADYVIVPAVHDNKDPALIGWVQEQAAHGATIVGICDGVPVLANAGLLEGRHATAHWYSLGGLEEDHPDTRWLRDLRYVADGNVVTTTGVSASVPVSLALVEAIAGWDRAEELAESLGVADWSVEHDSDAYGFTARHIFTGVGNLVAFWRRETIGIEVAPGVDEVSLALIADAWGRTFRSGVVSVAAEAEPIRTRGGLLLHPDRLRGGSEEPDRVLASTDRVEAGSALDYALKGIADSYGAHTAAFVALQLEYPWGAGE